MLSRPIRKTYLKLHPDWNRPPILDPWMKACSLKDLSGDFAKRIRQIGFDNLHRIDITLLRQFQLQQHRPIPFS